MFRRASLLLTGLVMTAFIAACSDNSPKSATADSASAGISGRVEAGLRVLQVDPAANEGAEYKIYRGDYVRLESLTSDPVTIAIPELKVEKTYPVSDGDKAYFKVPDVGRFSYTIGQLSGTIEAVDYTAKGYQEVSALEGQALIKNIDPLVLDVRTPREFEGGHLEGALLVPVQVLQKEIRRLGTDKNKPVFVYCRTGNRSTVAAKVLLDHGFTNVVNMRRGIREWQAHKLTIVK